MYKRQLQQVALLYTDVANAAFFTIFYVPMVPIIIFLFGKKSMHWSVWPSVVLCLIGGYLLTNFHDATVRLGDTLVVLGALFWSTHIIFTGIIITKYNLPLTLGAAQTLIVAIFSFIIGIIYEDFIFSNILMEFIQFYMQVYYLVDLHLYYKFMPSVISLQHLQL